MVLERGGLFHVGCVMGFVGVMRMLQYELKLEVK